MNHLKLALFIITAIVLIITISLYLISDGIDIQQLGNTSDFGSFGSYLGGIFGVAFGLLTVLLLIHSVDLQREILSEMRKEWRKTYESLQKQIAFGENESNRKQLIEIFTYGVDRHKKIFSTDFDSLLPKNGSIACSYYGCKNFNEIKRKVDEEGLEIELIREMYLEHTPLKRNQSTDEICITAIYNLIHEANRNLNDLVSISVNLIKLGGNMSIKGYWWEKIYTIVDLCYEVGILTDEGKRQHVFTLHQAKLAEG